MKTRTIRIAIAQINCTVGDLEGNAHKILQYIQRTKGFGVDIIAFPELALTGYPPEDLLLKPKFIEDNLKKIKEVGTYVEDAVAIVGFVDRKGRDLYNAAAILYNHRIRAAYHKMFLPNYGVFDEKRYFKAGSNPLVFRFGDYAFGVSICEDVWLEEGPTAAQAKLGAGLIMNINASPYHIGKNKEREQTVRYQARTHKVSIAYTNLVGGQDELVFDGQSMIVNSAGVLMSRAEAFKEDLLIVDLDITGGISKGSKRLVAVAGRIPDRQRDPLPKRKASFLKPIEEVYEALCFGLHDYVTKNSFSKVVIGLSGGIDSSLVTTLAADALGRENVIGVFMPSRYSSVESEVDAKQLAVNLGIKFITVSIEQIYKMYLVVLEPHFVGSERNIAEENLQARIRGNILMALSNKFGWLVLTTGNKSEMSTGYATLYGDMAGGFAVIKDVPKTLVYKLADYRNSLSFVIPQRVLIKAPTAELKHNQKDTDTLPPYETLDPVLRAYIEEDKDIKGIVSPAFDRDLVARVLMMVDASEYKRRQSPPGIKITPKAFGRDRRMPITNKYREYE